MRERNERGESKAHEAGESKAVERKEHGRGPVHKALGKDLKDEREGVRTYGKQARTFKASHPKAAKAVKAIQADEKRHVQKLGNLRKGR